MAKSKYKPYLNFMGLLHAGSSSFVKKDNELLAMKNCYEYEIGKLKKVLGYSVASNQFVSGKNINALHYYYDAAEDKDYLIAGSDSGSDYIIKYRTTGNWTSPTGTPTYTGKAGAEIDMATFLDKTFIVGHDSGTFLDNATIDGTVYAINDSDFNSKTGDAPQAKYITSYKGSLLYVGNVDIDGTKYPNRVYYSDEITAGAITWNNVATKHLTFGQDDGDIITGLVEALDRLIVFKHFSTWTWDESEKEKVLEIGCDSYRSIKVIGKIPYWFNRQGIWRWSGGKPQLISSKVQPFIDGMSLSLSQVIAAKYKNEYRLFIGDVTVEGDSYTNTWLCFDTLKEVWYVRCTHDTVKSACQYIESDVKRTYFGNDNGYAMKFAEEGDEIYADNSNDIDSFFITNNLDNGSPQTVNTNPEITIFSQNPQGMKMAVQVDNSGYFNKSNISILKKNVENKNLNLSGHRFKYKFYENSKNKPWELEGFIILTKEKES